MAKITQDINQIDVQSARIKARFDIAKIALEKRGYNIISLEEAAGLMIKEGHKSHISLKGTHTREGFIYIPKKGLFLTKDSPIMHDPKCAVEDQTNDMDFYKKDLVEKALANSIKIKELEIPTNRLEESELTRFAFGKNAKKYGEFLKENGKNDLLLYVIILESEKGLRFARQAYLTGLNPHVKSSIMGGRWLWDKSYHRGIIHPGRN